MSKLIKSQGYVQAHPCRLDPIDVDAFFINNQVILAKEEEAAENADEVPVDAQKPAQEDLQGEKEIHEGIQLAAAEEISGEDSKNQTGGGPESFDLNHLANVAEQIGALIDGAQPDNTAGTGMDISSILFKSKREILNSQDFSQETEEPKEQKKQETESLLAKLKRETAIMVEEMNPETSPSFLRARPLEERKREAEKNFFEAKNRALNLTDEAKKETDNQTGNPKIQTFNQALDAKNNLRDREHTENAKKQAGSILDSARQKAGEIATDASLRAEKLLNEAKQQAESIVETAKQTGDNLIQRSKEQADGMIQSAKQQEAEIIKTAGEEKEKLLATARQQAAEQAVSIKEQARAEGLQTGRQEGAAQIRAEFAKNLTTALSLLMQTEEEREKRISSSEPEILKLAVYIAERIIGDELRLDPKRQIDIMREALSRVTTATNLLIRLHPDDCPLISENISSLQEVFSEPKPIKLEGDPGIPKGSCFIETDHGNIDSRIKSQLDMIITELLKVGLINE